MNMDCNDLIKPSELLKGIIFDEMITSYRSHDRMYLIQIQAGKAIKWKNVH